MRKTNEDIGNASIEKMVFSEGVPERLISLNVAELYDYGCNLWLGFDGNEERLIYTLDFENSFNESRFPRGTIEKLIRALPLANTLIMDKTNDIIITKLI